ncbi:hypothetical protein A2U01_0077425 [Trifolium medium]|uniref:Uncharacterized protein n=1 Tax=Trifolium medium TaxID=97028 RepID=A0A392T6M3_9FABA|nr:hypothetical protein [Trifolium medium]
MIYDIEDVLAAALYDALFNLSD